MYMGAKPRERGFWWGWQLRRARGQRGARRDQQRLRSISSAKLAKLEGRAQNEYPGMFQEDSRLLAEGKSVLMTLPREEHWPGTWFIVKCVNHTVGWTGYRSKGKRI